RVMDCAWRRGRRHPGWPLFPYTTLFRSGAARVEGRVWEADGLDTAFLLGLFRPRIYLPSGLGDAERAIALAHEGTHLRYGDHVRSEEHTSELQSRFDLVCRLLLDKTKER